VSRKIIGHQRDEATGLGRDFVMRGLVICRLLLARCCLGDQMKEKKIGRICSTYGKKNVYWSWQGSLKERRFLKDLGLDGRITLK
jgi:hypothetical protein